MKNDNFFIEKILLLLTTFLLLFCSCNLDSDKDSIPDADDNCPTVLNSDQADLDDDGIGDACDTDYDNDGISDENDNCPHMENPDQNDADSDGEGDDCEDSNCYFLANDTNIFLACVARFEDIPPGALTNNFCYKNNDDTDRERAREECLAECCRIGIALGVASNASECTHCEY